MFYEVKVNVEFVLRFDADTHKQAELELEDTLNAIRLMDGVTVTNESHNL